jgi:cellulose synthase/poly-beta-1,6-N-acetylglucosamine synthase-like glycosyltransferase
VSDRTGLDSSHQPRVTVVVSPRERFGMARSSLESIYATAGIPFDLIYIDARSPAYVSDWLKAEAPVRGFRVIKLDRFVNPNEARNMGAAAAKSEFIAFIDNDVICADGWLAALVKAADETGSDITAPLVCEGVPLHSRVHQATGSFTPDKAAFFATPHGKRELIDIMTHHSIPLAQVHDQLRREETDTCEFHCLMVRRSFLEKMGPLPFDEEMYATKEHIDFCMTALKEGGKLIFEPTSIVTYVFPNRQNPMRPDDLPYFLLRWSPEWQVRSLDHIQKKWGLQDSGEMKIVRDPAYMRMRQYEGFIKPLVRKLPVVRSSWKLRTAANRILRMYVDRRVKSLAAEYERQRAAYRQATSAA